MEAVCKGEKSQGGTTVGILPRNDPNEAIAYVGIPICTGMWYAHKAIVVKSGQAVIAIAGSFGSLSEIGHASGDNIHVIGLKTWILERKNQPDTSILEVNNPLDAVEKAIEADLGHQKAARLRGSS
jgi:uncharacterized protein (TIGR00725 family)